MIGPAQKYIIFKVRMAWKQVLELRTTKCPALILYIYIYIYVYNLYILHAAAVMLGQLFAEPPRLAKQLVDDDEDLGDGGAHQEPKVAPGVPQ